MHRITSIALVLALPSMIGPSLAQVSSASNLPDATICENALNRAGTDWDPYVASARFKKEATFRGLTVEKCQEIVGLSQGTPNQNAASNSEVIAEEIDDRLSLVIESWQAQFSSLDAKFSAFNELQKGVGDSFKQNTASEINRIVVQLKDLEQSVNDPDKEAKLNRLSDEIGAIKQRSLTEDPAFKSLSERLQTLDEGIASAKQKLANELAALQSKHAKERLADLQVIDQKMADMGNKVQELRDNSRLEAENIKASINSQLSGLTSQLEKIASSVSELQANQEQLSADQEELTKRQEQTEKKIDSAQQMLANILLPVTEDQSEWMLRIAAIPLQQQQFCRIVDAFHDDLENVYKSRNAIKKNALYKERQQDLASLLPGGKFESWVVRVIEVAQAQDGSAAIILQPPCRAMLGSDDCSPQSGRVKSTIPPDSLIYRELSRLDTGDYVAISGTILYAESTDPNKPLPEFAVYEPQTHCTRAEGAKDQEVFVTQLSALSKLR